MSQIITSIEAGRTRSWVDPIGARELSSLVQRDLHRKFEAIKARGGKVYFITKTYDPAPWLPDGVEWESATEKDRAYAGEKCWDAMADDRHLHHSMKRLEASIGLDLSGRWWSKREFTKNGFLHHHVILDGPDYLPFDQVYDCWGFGRVDCQVARSAGGLAWYVGKYCTKYGDEPPAWIMQRPAGSLRFTTCSDGWWSGDLGTVPAVKRFRGVGRRSVSRSDRAEDKAYGCYETVGDRIARKGRSVTVRCDGEREEVQGVTLDEFRRHRGPGYDARSIVKARRSMDAVVGLPLSQACRELRDVAAMMRDDPSLQLPVCFSGPSACGGEKTPPGRDPAAGGIAAATGEQMGLYSHDACHGSVTGTVGPAVPISRSESGVSEPSVMARGLLTLSSPQECGEGDEVKVTVGHQGIPPDF